MSHRTTKSTALASVLACAVLATLTTQVVQAPAALAAPPSGQYVLQFSDEFNGTSVDTAKWNFRTDVKGLSAQLARNVTLADGIMTINLKKEAVSGMQYTGGGLVSKQTFRYGYYETRAKTHRLAGFHTAFWTQKGNGTTTFPPEHRTEVDGFENDSDNRMASTFNIQRWSGSMSTFNPCLCSGLKQLGFDASADFHTYGFEWTETQVKYFVDGQLIHTNVYPANTGSHDFGSIWLTAIALNHGFGVNEAGLPGTAQFDYIRYYQRDGYTDNDDVTKVRYSETGTWLNSSLRGHTLDNISRYSTTAGATAKWDMFVPAAGQYDVFIYKVVHPNSDTNSRIDITHAGGTATTSLNFTTGVSEWVNIGRYSFGAGNSGSVKLTRGNNSARADAVKFIRV